MRIFFFILCIIGIVYFGTADIVFHDDIRNLETEISELNEEIDFLTTTLHRKK